MGSYGIARCVEERSFGSLKDPLGCWVRLLTDVDLHAFSGDSEDGVLRGRRLGGVLADCSCCEGESDGEDQGELVSWRHPQQFTPCGLSQDQSAKTVLRLTIQNRRKGSWTLRLCGKAVQEKAPSDGSSNKLLGGEFG